MPTVSLMKYDVEAKLGSMTEDEFNDLCFEFGLELDEVTSEYEIVLKEQGAMKAENCSKEIIYKVDVPANRYDLLCVEGLTRALSIFKSKCECPRYTLKPEKPSISLTVDDKVKQIRPFVVAALLRNVSFNQARYNSFIALQDKLHSTIGRNRSLVSIGTHDFDTLTPPFRYSAREPNQIKFIPLNDTTEYTADALMEHYNSTESHLKPYLHIIRDSPVYPVIEDSAGVVCSLPPIINGQHSRIHNDTKNIFIEITATNKWKASVTLDTVVTLFSEYCTDQFTVEPIEIITSSENNNREIYPELTYRSETISIDYINKCLGTNLKSSEVSKLFSRMGLSISVCTDSVLNVEIPPTRHDVIHRCDLMEDVAIAVGYGNIERRMDLPNTTGGLQPVDKLTTALRFEMLRCGFTEALSFVLCSRDDVSTRLGTTIDQVPAVHISNPKTAEFQVCRTTLLPGILWTVQTNQHLPLPLGLFEVQDVVLKTESKDLNITGSESHRQAEETGARNERHLCAVKYGRTAEFEELLNVLYTTMSSLGVAYLDPSSITGDSPSGYSLQLLQGADPALMLDRDFRILYHHNNKSVDIGRLGILHPDVLRRFNIRKGLASYFEVNVEPFL